MGNELKHRGRHMVSKDWLEKWHHGTYTGEMSRGHVRLIAVRSGVAE